jgi:hypothetical protein
MEAEIERLTAELDKAKTVIASAYQAVGILVLSDGDEPWPSNEDQTNLLDMLSRCESWPAEQVESFLPWPKKWAELESPK